jgi:hypothetical protein
MKLWPCWWAYNIVEEDDILEMDFHLCL